MSLICRRPAAWLTSRLVGGDVRQMPSHVTQTSFADDAQQQQVRGDVTHDVTQSSTVTELQERRQNQVVGDEWNGGGSGGRSVTLSDQM